MNPLSRFKPFLILAVALMLAALVSVACGDEETPTPIPTNTPVPVQATNTPVPAQPTDTPVPTAVPAETGAMPGPDADERGGVIPLMSFGSPQQGIAFFGSTLLTGASHETALTNALIHLNPETPDPTDLGGDMAKEWSASADGLVYTVRLHEGVVSHEGKPVGAEDVVLSLIATLEPQKLPDEYAELRGMLDTAPAGPLGSWVRTFYKEARVVDNLTVEIEAKFASPLLLSSLGDNHIKIVPFYLFREGRIPGWNKPETLIGTGPFKLVEYEQDVKSVNERNPLYFKEGKPYVDGLVHFILSDASAVIAAYKTEQVLLPDTGINNLSHEDTVKLAEEEPDKLTLHVGGPLYQTGLTMNADKEPGNIPEVRRAMMLALHRQPLIETFGSDNLLGTPFPCGFSWSYTCEEAAQIPGFREDPGNPGTKHPEDIAEARRLSGSVGWGEGSEVTLTCSIVIEYCDMAVLVKEQLENFLGWDVTINSMEFAAGTDFIRTRQYQIAIESNGLFTPNAAAVAASWTNKDSRGFEISGFYNPEAEALWDPITRAKTLEETTTLVAQANEILLKDHGWPMIYYPMRGWLVNNRIKGFNPPLTLFAGMKQEHIWCPSCK